MFLFCGWRYGSSEGWVIFPGSRNWERSPIRIWAPCFGINIAHRGWFTPSWFSSNHLFLISYMFLSIANHVLMKASLCLCFVLKGSLLFVSFNLTSQSYSPNCLQFFLTSTQLLLWLLCLAMGDIFLSEKDRGLDTQRWPLKLSRGICPFQSTDSCRVSHSK